MRLIDKDALLEAYDKAHEGPPGAARMLIEDAPTIEHGTDSITIKWTPDLDKLVRDVAYRGLNEFSFMGKSIREWVEIILEQPSWISVKDRLPCENPWESKWVLVWFGEESALHTEAPLPAKWNPNERTWWIVGFSDKYEGMKLKVTHWMPLPPPPQEVT